MILKLLIVSVRSFLYVFQPASGAAPYPQYPKPPFTVAITVACIGTSSLTKTIVNEVAATPPEIVTCALDSSAKVFG